MKISELITEAALMELSFHGSQCTKDCSGHKAGYAWSQARGGVDAMGHSASFNKGSAIGTRIMAMNQQKAHPQRKRPVKDVEQARRAQATQRVAQGVQGTPDPVTPTITEKHMKFNEFAPTPGYNPGGDGDGNGMPWNQFAHAAMRWMKGHGFSAHPMPGHEAVQFSKRHGDEHDTEYHDDEDDVWLQAIMDSNGDGTFNYMMASVTNGEMDQVLDDYQGTARMDAHGLNHFILLAEEAFGL